MDQLNLITSKTFLRELLNQAFLDLILAPANRALILIQTRPYTDEAGTNAEKLRGTLSAITQIIKQEGFTSLWRGGLVEALKNSIFKASNLLFLKLYELILISESSEINELGTTIREYLLLFAAEFSTLLVHYPFKVVRIKMSGLEKPSDHNIPKRNEFRRIYDTMQEIYRTEGIPGFYRGFSAALLQSLNVMALTAAKQPLLNWMYPEIKETKSAGRLLKDLLTVGSPAGVAKSYIAQSMTIKRIKNNAEKQVFKLAYQAFSTLWLYPFNIVQARAIVRNDHSPKKIIESPLVVVKEIWDKEGLDGFYRGVFTNLVINLGAYMVQSTAQALAEGVAGREPEQEEENPAVEEQEAKTYIEMKRRGTIFLNK